MQRTGALASNLRATARKTPRVAASDAFPLGCNPSKAWSDLSCQTRDFLDPFLVSSRLLFSMAVMGAVDPAYILIYPEY